MMHGRAGPLFVPRERRLRCDTLSKRHQAWGELWAAHGYVALMVDGFGPRGYPAGFPRHSYDSRPEELNEVTVRPLDAYGALAYLRTRADVDGARIGLQGWSNGGSATLAAMAAGTGFAPASPKGFARRARVLSGLRTEGRIRGGLPAVRAGARVHGHRRRGSLAASAARRWSTRAAQQGGDIAITLYPGATHGFDDPGAKRQKVEANAEATEDAIARAAQFFASRLRG